MATNKFATMLHRNSHKLTVILVYAVLEWILIILLLLNSFFTYLITKFANYFGLKPPCVWCSRVDHVLEPGNNTNSYRDHVCETHASEISKLGYCSNHRRLGEIQNMCMDCSVSRPNHNNESIGMTRRIAFISWMSRDTVENSDKILRCSCCNENLKNNSLYPPYLLFKPSWKTLRHTQKGNLIIEALDDDEYGREIECRLLSKPDSFAVESNEFEINDGEEHQMLSDVGSFGLKDSAEEECSSRSESSLQCDEKESNEDQKSDSPCTTEDNSDSTDFVHQSFDDDIIQHCHGDDSSLEIINLHSERNLEYEYNRLIPIELIDSSTSADLGSFILKKEDLAKQDHQREIFYSSLQNKTLVFAEENKDKPCSAEVKSLVINMDDDEQSSVFNLGETKKDLVGEACELVISIQAAKTLSVDGTKIEVAGTEKPEDPPAQEDDSQLLVDQTKPKPFKKRSDAQESSPLPCPQEDHSSAIDNGAEILNAPETYELGPNNGEKTSKEGKMISADKNQEAISQHSTMHLESHEADEEKFPETPTSSDSFHYLHKKLLLFEKRESGTEESLDGSVVSETDAGDPVLTVEKLKTALKAERKVLNALYSELEEERSASAIAANQTMAMINRLQEEKAAMQMEALQYQRMMEEQSEYDQEALQLLNELMVKREREKQEVEKELEVCRKKVLEYEAKEKIRNMRRSRDGSMRSRNSSATCSNSEDIDELSIDLNREARDEDGSIYGDQDNCNNNTAEDEVINLEEIALDCVKQISSLDDSLAEFEEERLSILDQLKALEEKLITLHEKELIEEDNLVDNAPRYSVKGFDESYGLSTPEENGISHRSLNDTHCAERKTMGSMAKSPLPLLDAADNETEEGLIFEENVASEIVEIENHSVSKCEVDSKKLALVEEVDHVYERLQALEADREFLKHCMSSIQKGDKGMDLLQEILQHLRDLRAVELRVRNMSDDPLG